MNTDEYERTGRALHADFAETVASILESAISKAGGFRLQQVKSRAKDCGSLRKKLIGRGLQDSQTIEAEIKDLAGCRAIFYTNGDVTRFVRSGLVQENFEVLEVKLHQPAPTVDDAKDLYVSNHFVVRLKPDRLSLTEYSHLAALRCEIQVQTILNHTWAEMAHDIIYKEPEIGSAFGRAAFQLIKDRMKRIAEVYLVPAGHEVQKVATDFQRLVEGKELFDGRALDEVVSAANNNARADALSTFAENVLPLYDDINSVYPEVVWKLVEATRLAKDTASIPIETPFGTLNAKTFDDIVAAVAEVFRQYRYVDIKLTMEALLSLWLLEPSEKGRKALLKLAKALADHQIEVWKKVGPRVQEILVERIAKFGDDELEAYRTLVVAMLESLLGTEVRGTTSSSSAVTLHRGAVVASSRLAELRAVAIAQLKRLFELATTDKDRAFVLQALYKATQHPINVSGSDALALQIMEDCARVIDYWIEIAPRLSLELTQRTEVRVHWLHRAYSALPPLLQGKPEFEAMQAHLIDSAIRFRDAVNANEDYVIYKTLVGFDSVFAPHWEHPPHDYERDKKYRKSLEDQLLERVDEGGAELWFDRLNRYAMTDDTDRATFMTFGSFIHQIAATRPHVAMRFIARLQPPLESFLPAFLKGLGESTARKQAEALMNHWIDTNRYLVEISLYFRSMVPPDHDLFRKLLVRAKEVGDLRSVCNMIIAASDQFEREPGTLIDEILLPAISYLAERGNFDWLHNSMVSWYESKVAMAMELPQAERMLQALARLPEIESSAEQVLGAVAERWPAAVLQYFAERLALERTDAKPTGFNAIPYSIHQLSRPLSAQPDLLLAVARGWYEQYPEHFQFEGGRLIAAVFNGLPPELSERLDRIADEGTTEALEFVLAVLDCMEGVPQIFELVRKVVSMLPADSPLLSDAHSVLMKTSVVRGEFGFAEAYEQKRLAVAPWREDTSEPVRSFATEFVRRMDGEIAAEHRSAEASIAMRKLSYGESIRPMDGATGS
ncbi:MAG: hypothetical protein C0434_12110 [Xanthomonadaceae bacterium]|nr:hypothetical protein [Xanthomonadaceae bacterium]